MLRSFGRLLPAAVVVRQALLQPASFRSFWDSSRFSHLWSLARYLKRPRYIQVSGFSSTPNTYQYSIDVQGFKPEEIKVVLKGRVLTVTAKTERKSKDGIKLYKDFVHKVTIPRNVKGELITAYLQNGVLTVEAPLKPGSGPKK